MFLALAGDHGTGCTTDRRANRRARAAAGDAADDGAEPDPATNLAGGLLPFPGAFALDVGGGDLVGLASEGDRVGLQRDLVAAFHSARLRHAGGLYYDDRASRDHHLAIEHHGIVDQRAK